MGLKPEFALVGGTANNRGLVRSIEENLKAKLVIPEQPQIMAAIGAALMGVDVK